MLLSFKQTQKLLAAYGIDYVAAKACKTQTDVFKAGLELSPPWVLKALAHDVPHKTEKNLIALDLHSLDELRMAFDRLQKNVAGHPVECFLLQQQLKGAEFIVGGKRDPVFGGVVVFGSGGIFTELYEDVSMRVTPLTAKDAREMIHETKASKFFSSQGFRGRKANKQSVVKLLLKTSKLLDERLEVKELDFNPVIAWKDKAVVVDARVVLC